MCVCFLSFPAPRHALIGRVLERGLDVFASRSYVYGGLGAWLFMDVLRESVGADGFDVRPISVGEALCWPAVTDATKPQSRGAVDAIMRDCATVHMMGGAHARKFGSTLIDDSSLFGQVYARVRPALPLNCSAY
jgi:hypothetical protein